MASEGQPSRRLACDRCRTQKLKCVRMDNVDSCQRCHTAKTACSFGRPLPSGRPSSVRAHTTSCAGDNRMNASAAFRPTGSMHATYHPELQLNTTNDHNLQHGLLSIPEQNHLMDASFPDRGWPQPVDFSSDDTMFNMLYDDAVMTDFNSSTLGNWLATSIDDQSKTQMMGQLGDASRYTMNTDMPITAPPSRKISPRMQGAELMMQTSMDRKQRHGSISSASGMGQDMLAQHSPILMQKLIELSSSMYEIQNAYPMDEHTGRPLNLSADIFPTELAGKVIQAAIDLLKILRCFFSDDSGSNVSNTPTSRHQGILDLNNMEAKLNPAYNMYQNFSGTNTPTSSVPTLASSRTSSSSSSASLRSNEWASRRVSATADKTTTLQLIGNYLQLLRLYLLLHNVIYDYVRCTELDHRHSQPIWTDLALGNAPFFQFADLQIKMVLQVGARLLEEIEGALGLAEGCRVSRRSVNEGTGILEMNATPQFVEMCLLSEATTGSEQGQGTITRLQELMHCLSNLLDTPICL